MIIFNPFDIWYFKSFILCSYKRFIENNVTYGGIIDYECPDTMSEITRIQVRISLFITVAKYHLFYIKCFGPDVTLKTKVKY